MASILESPRPTEAKHEPALAGYPGALSMSKDEVLERLCDMLHSVWEAFDPNAHEPNDCFCPKANTAIRFQTSAQALRWVEALVSDALRRRSDARPATPSKGEAVTWSKTSGDDGMVWPSAWKCARCERKIADVDVNINFVDSAGWIFCSTECKGAGRPSKA